jgi:hypothetical protein
MSRRTLDSPLSRIAPFTKRAMKQSPLTAREYANISVAQCKAKSSVSCDPCRVHIVSLPERKVGDGRHCSGRHKVMTMLRWNTCQRDLAAQYGTLRDGSDFAAQNPPANRAPTLVLPEGARNQGTGGSNCSSQPAPCLPPVTSCQCCRIRCSADVPRPPRAAATGTSSC